MADRPSRNLAHRSAAALLSGALLLATGCGGGGGGGGSDGGEEPPPSFPALGLTPVAAGFSQPVHLVHAGDGSGRLFVVERRGVVRILRDGQVLPSPFLDISPAVQSGGGEQGLLALAFPPDFATRRHFYVHYTGRSGVGDSVLARHVLSADPDVAEGTGGTALLRVVQPFTNHNGGQIAFGPDGLLYVALGDGGGSGDPSGNGQNLATVLGKVLRLDVEAGASPYAIPPGNPFGSEIWAYGLRNPWRFSFDRATGDLYIADVGQAFFEEINIQPAASPGGENYGWNRMEGAHCFNAASCDQSGLTLPVAEYDHSGGECSITGGFVYRGARHPALQGIYLYADFCTGRVWGLRPSGTGWESRLLLETGLQISTFGEDEAGELYLADFRGGGVYRIEVP